jgi:hypothetical protein
MNQYSFCMKWYWTLKFIQTGSRASSRNTKRTSEVGAEFCQSFELLVLISSDTTIDSSQILTGGSYRVTDYSNLHVHLLLD